MKYLVVFQLHAITSRSPCGERGLKCLLLETFDSLLRRSPCGERGLKYLAPKSVRCSTASLPVRGAWIEIVVAVEVAGQHQVAPRAGSVD